MGQYVGFRYSVTLPKNKSAQIGEKLSTHNQFPITVRMRHPEIIDPKTGKGFTVSNWTDTMFKHNKNLAMWYFGEKNELVSGRWTLEILYRNLVLVKKSFLLFNLDKKPNQYNKTNRSLNQALVLSSLVLQGEKVLCAKNKFRKCLDFNSEYSCESSIKPFKKLCQKVAILAVKRTIKRDSSANQLKKYFTYYTACMASNYIKKTDLIPQQVGMCFSK